MNLAEDLVRIDREHALIRPVIEGRPAKERVGHAEQCRPIRKGPWRGTKECSESRFVSERKVEPIADLPRAERAGLDEGVAGVRDVSLRIARLSGKHRGG